jgi:wee1-like protein kinase
MIEPNPEMRPSAISLIRHRVLSSYNNKSKAQLHQELNTEKLKSEILAKQLEIAEQFLKALPTSVIQQFSGNVSHLAESKQPLSARMSRLIGKKVNRSHSTTSF